jgi:hypothetical protein
VVLAACSGFAQDAEESQGPIAINVEGSFNFGPIDGFLQTPAGGRPGTSSTHRPKFDELGVNDVAFYDTRLNAQWRHLVVYGGYQFIRLSGSDTLSQPLVSHGVAFAARDRLSTDDQLDWSRAGAGWSFVFLDHRLDLTPKAELALFNFQYHLSSASRSADRSYIKGCARVGIDSKFHLNRILSVNLDGSASLPLSNTPQIATLTATASLRFLPESHRLKPHLFGGVGMEWIDYEDNQSLPNHIKADIGPFLTAGITATF